MSIHSCEAGRNFGGEKAISQRLAYSPAETERLLGVSHATVYRLIAAGRLDARKIGNRTVIFASSIEKLLASLPKVANR
jgi:excisionase family DNA binding protein